MAVPVPILMAFMLLYVTRFWQNLLLSFEANKNTYPLGRLGPLLYNFFAAHKTLV